MPIDHIDSSKKHTEPINKPIVSPVSKLSKIRSFLFSFINKPFSIIRRGFFRIISPFTFFLTLIVKIIFLIVLVFISFYRSFRGKGPGYGYKIETGKKPSIFQSMNLDLKISFAMINSWNRLNSNGDGAKEEKDNKNPYINEIVKYRRSLKIGMTDISSFHMIVRFFGYFK